ncbi:hypothetical protein HY479_03935 [Candidatus Uhrbacteria bacterium]|nr:hypothetical protein [Candidatus Uhrbacteria bacterium]
MPLRPFLLSALSLLGLLAAATSSAATLTPGDLVKASGPSVYYYAENGKRYVFPTEKTYLTWYADFSSVKTVTDAELGALMIGGNATYRPGVKLVKITTDPKVYAIGPGNQLRWIKTEQVAKELYGADWATQVDDIPDPFFINYMLGAEVSSAGDYDRTALRDAAPTIQATLTAPAPAPAPVPTPTPAPTSTGGIQFSVSKAMVRAGDVETLTASASSTSGIAKIELYFDGSLIQTCNSTTCTGEATVPISGTKSSYEARAKAIAVNTDTFEKLITVPLDTSASALARLTIERPIIRQGQVGSAIVDADASVAVLRTDIYRDSVSVKACASGIRQCRWSDPLTGAVGTVYDFYGLVTDTIGRTYQTPHKTITVGTNDTPFVTVAVGKSSIYTGETVDVTVMASDDDGITMIDILKDGAVIKTCQGASPCSMVTGPWPSVGALHFNGRATDTLGLSATNDDTVVTVTSAY